MLLNKAVEFTPAIKRKGAIIAFLFFLPSIMKFFGLSRQVNSVILNSFLALSDQINSIFYPTFLIIYMGGGLLLGLPTFLLTLFLVYKLACILVVVWEEIFDGMFGRRSRFLQIVVLVFLLAPFIYHAIYIPSLIASRFKVKANIPAEISISKDPKTFYDKNGSFQRYIVQEFIVRNDNDFQKTHEVPREVRGMCLYSTQTGAFSKLGGYYAHEDGHGFVDPGTWNTLIVGPKSEARYYLLGDMALSDEYDEILLSKDGSYISDKYCYNLTTEDIEKNQNIEIIKISK